MKVSPPAPAILYVVTKARFGGAQRYVYDLAVAAKEAGYPVWVATGEEGPLCDMLHEAGIPQHTIATMQRDVSFFADLHSGIALWNLIRKLKPTVVHLNSAKAAGLGSIVARLCGVPRIIFTAHGWAFNEERPWWQKVLIYIFSWITILLSHRTIAVSHAVLRDTADMPFVHHKMTVVHLGARLPLLLPKETSRKALLTHSHGVWVGSVAELHPTKRLRDLLDAFSRIAPEFPEARLVIIGEGQERRALEDQSAALGLTGRIHFVGFVPNAAAHLPALDVFVLPSHSEGLGYVLMEAGHATLPTIATEVGGIPEIIDAQTGLLVPPRSPEALAHALRALLMYPEKAQRLGRYCAAEKNSRDLYS
jgi:glycosyltransferase involved in cell wall biosynthesis